jgi:hypothetical protein
MRLVESDNKHLWYVYDMDDKICFTSMFREVCIKYIQANGIRK